MVESKMRSWWETNRFTYISTLVWGFIAHMYLYTHVILNHDNISIAFSDDKWTYLSAGRWLLGWIFEITDNKYIPWISGLLCLSILAVFVDVLCKVFDIVDKVKIGLVAGIIVTSMQVLTFHIYTSSIVAYALAALMFAFPVLLVKKRIKGYRVLSILCICGGTAIYNPFFCITVTLFVLYFIYIVYQNQKKTSRILIEGFESIGIMICGLLLWKVITDILILISGINMSSYMGEDTYGQYSGIVEFLWLCSIAFKQGIKYFFFDGYISWNSSIMILFHYVIVVLFIIGWIVNKKESGKEKIYKTVVLGGLGCILPVALNCMVVIVPVVANTNAALYRFAHILPYVLIIALLPLIDKKAMKNWKDKLLFGISTGGIGFFLLMAFHNAILCNSAYVKIENNYQIALAAANRLIYRIEESIVPDDERTIVTIGNFEVTENRGIIKEGYEALRDIGVVEVWNSITTQFLLPYFTEQALGWGRNVINIYDIPEMREELQPIIDDMEIYPRKDCIKETEEYIIVKLSDQW